MSRRFAACSLLVIFGVGVPVWGATTVAGVLSGNPHWTLEGSPYQLTGNTTLPAGQTLTIDPGVRVVAYAPCSLIISGHLQIDASDAQRVYFFPNAALPAGQWGGVTFTAGGSGEITGATFSSGQTNATVSSATVSFTGAIFHNAVMDSLVVSGNSSLTARNCTFTSNGRRGLYVETIYPQGLVTDCHFRDNQEYPIWIKANCMDMLGAGLQFSGNHYQSIAVSCSAGTDIQRSQSWRGQPVALDLTVGSTSGLTVPAGVTLTVAGPVTALCRRFEVAGTLRVGTGNGYQAWLTGPADTRGSWEGIHVSSGGVLCLTDARLTYATTGVSANGATVTLTGSRIVNSLYDGLSTTSDCTVHLDRSYLRLNGRSGLNLLGRVTGRVQNTELAYNGSHPVYALAANVSCLGSGNLYPSNGRIPVGVSCALEPDLTESATWTAQSVAYDLTVNPYGTVFSIGAGCVLTLSPGTLVRGGGVDVHGCLEALGTAAQPVRFLPLGRQEPGSWEGLYFYPGSTALLRHCQVYYAKVGMAITSAGGYVANSQFRSCSGPGISCAGTANPTFYRCVISDNQGVGVYTRDSAAPNLGNLDSAPTHDDGYNILQNNGQYDFRNESSVSPRAQNNYWGTTDPAVVEARIWDGRDQAGLGRVWYLPLATSPAAAFAAPVTGLIMAGATALQAPGGNVEIRVHLLSPASVSLRVCNVAGRVVCSVPDRLTGGVGERLILWNARSDTGRRLPAGAYLLELTARSPDGPSTRRLVPLVLR